MVTRITEGITLHYYTGEDDGIDNDYEVDTWEYFKEEVFPKLTEEDKIRIINKYSSEPYDPEFDIDDQLYDVIDDYLNDEGYDDMYKFYEERAWEEYADWEEYQRDPLGYVGMSIHDFL